MYKYNNVNCVLQRKNCVTDPVSSTNYLSLPNTLCGDVLEKGKTLCPRELVVIGVGIESWFMIRW